jgi:hypothetical protein
MQRPWLRAILAILLLLFEPEWRALTGRARLGRVFWVYGVLASSGLALLFVLAREAGRGDLQQATLLVILAYTAGILVAVWRCGAQAGPPWGVLARALTVAWAVNTLLLVGFLQVELLAAWIGGSAS